MLKRSASLQPDASHLKMNPEYLSGHSKELSHQRLTIQVVFRIPWSAPGDTPLPEIFLLRVLRQKVVE